MDSLLQAEILTGLGVISLFEPAYPQEEELKRIVNYTTERSICNLKRCFGLPAYRITPSAAKYLLKKLNPLVNEPIIMGRGIPTHYSETLDGALNNQYENIGAKIVFPPLALALNNQNESLTRKSEATKLRGLRLLTKSLYTVKLLRKRSLTIEITGRERSLILADTPIPLCKFNF